MRKPTRHMIDAMTAFMRHAPHRYATAAERAGAGYRRVMSHREQAWQTGKHTSINYGHAARCAAEEVCRQELIWAMAMFPQVRPTRDLALYGTN